MNAHSFTNRLRLLTSLIQLECATISATTILEATIALADLDICSTQINTLAQVGSNEAYTLIFYSNLFLI